MHEQVEELLALAGERGTARGLSLPEGLGFPPSGWLEMRTITKPSGRRFGPYLYWRAKVAGGYKAVCLGRVPDGQASPN